MGLMDKLKRGNIRDHCHKDRETGAVVCKRVRVSQDGTEVELAGFTANVDANCNAVPEDVFENEGGQLAQLEKKFLPNIVGKCTKNTPEDY